MNVMPRIVRRANDLLARVQTRLRWQACPARPRFVTLEITNRCTGTCVLCPVGQGRVGRPYGDMTFEQFRRIVEQIRWHGTFVSLYKWGDPLLHPHVYELAAYAVSRGLNCRISSNLHGMDPRDAKRLLATGVGELVVSLHGISRETYETYQPGHDWAATMEKLAALVAARKELKANRPSIRLNFVVRKDNQHEVRLLEAFSNRLGIGYTIIEPSLNIRFLDGDFDAADAAAQSRLRRARLDAIERWLPDDPRWVKEGYRRMLQADGEMPAATDRRWRCTCPWTSICISWNGDVDVCASMFYPQQSVGNVFERPLREIWNNAQYRAARRHVAGRADDEAAGPAVPCATCTGTCL